MQTLRSFFTLAVVAGCLLALSNIADTSQKKQDKKDTKPKVETPKKEEKKEERVYPKVEPTLVLKGHKDWVYHAFYTPDQKFLVTSSRDKTLRIWDAGSGKEVRLIKDLAAPPLTLALSPDGSKLATTGGKWLKDKKQWVGEIALFNFKSGERVATIQGHVEGIVAIAFHPQGELLASASDDGLAKIWNIAKSAEVQNLKGHVGQVSAVAFSGDGKWLATGGADMTIKVWDPATGKEEKSLTGPKRAIGSVVFSPDGKLLAGGSLDGTVTLWDTTDFKQIRVLNADDGITALAFSPDPSKLATGGWDGVVKIWDVKTGQELGGLAGHTAAISSVVFNAAGDKVVSASLDETVRIWDVSSAKKSELVKKEEKK